MKAFFMALHVIAAPIVHSQGIQSFQFGQSGSTLPLSNSVDVLFRSRDTLWVGTAKGLSHTFDGGLSWTHFAGTLSFDERGISAVGGNDAILWTASAYAQKRDNEDIPVGAGLRYSTDRGASWSYVPQPLDAGTVDTLTYGINRIRALAITVPQQNITYDISATNSAVWIASFAGMLRRSTDRGATWTRVILPPDGLNSIAPTDTLDFDLSPAGGNLGLRENLNHRVFSVLAENDSTIWVGTAGGINKSTDGGVRWQKFSHQNQAQPISGNFVVALHHQRYQTRSILWAATVNALDPDEEQAVSFSEDGGTTWKTTLPGERAHNIASRDSVVYVAADRGLFRSSDFGMTWLRSGTVSDPVTGQRFASPNVFAVAVQGDTVWIGGPEGTAYTFDQPGQPFGSIWKLFRAYQPLASSSLTYSYPSPFSPDDQVVRVHYRTPPSASPVTIRIFDYALMPVRTLLQNAARPANTELDEIWDGKDEFNRLVSNGVYFYRVEMGAESAWGKIFVLK